MSLDDLYQRFRDPPTTYGLRPLWFWNGKLTPAEVQRQMEQLVEQGVHSAYVMAWSGLRPRYLSEEWWELVEAAVEKARELGFHYAFADEFNWPSGEARDYTLPGYPSRVLEANPGLRMRSLFPERRDVAGGDDVTVPDAAELHCAVALDPRSGETIELTRELRAGLWRAPDGEWHLYLFRLEESIGFDGGLVDLMNPETTRTFIDLVFEEYYRRFPDDFGSTIVASRSDHEGDYGYRLAWTPRLFEVFRERKGYDLVPALPLLLEDGGRRTPTVRCDYFEVVGDLYAQGFLGQLASWGAAHGIRTDGHVWEETLHAQAAFQGDHFAMQRAFGNPGIDSLFEWGRFPRHFLEARSVAHFRELPLVVEHQGVQGADSYLSPERAKRTTNTIAAWGTGVFSTHAMRADLDRSDYPEDWFETQPWWPFFHHYADYVRRLSFMNVEGRHRCDLALYYPIESAWANADAAFLPERWNYSFTRIEPDQGMIVSWDNDLDEIDAVYTDIQNRLPAAQRDLDVVDAHYLGEASIADGRLRIGQETFTTLILPPMTCLRLSAARHIRAFAESGGRVIAVGRLPQDSMENGRDDPDLARALAAANPIRVADVDALLAFLDENVPRDVRVVSGDPDHLVYSHRVIDGTDCYWLVNDSEAARSLRVEFAAAGMPERWDPDGGTRSPVGFAVNGERIEVELRFTPWQAYYVVFEGATPRLPSVSRSNLDVFDHPVDRNGSFVVRGSARADGRTVEVAVANGEHRYRGTLETAKVAPFTLGGPWSLSPAAEHVPVAYTRTAVADHGEGVALGWHLREYNDSFWATEWLSPERFALRDWYVLGPFDYRLHLGWSESLPPETACDLDATYDGKEGPVRWRRYRSESHIVDLEKAVGWGAGGYAELASFEGRRSATIFALTHVFSPDDRSCELRIVGDANAKAWVNGELVASERDDHLGYLDLRDSYAQRVPVQLRRGWNRVLAKVSQAVRFPPGLRLYARLCDTEGGPLDIVCCASADERSKPEARGERWYRMPVPQSSAAVRLSGLGTRAEVYVDGERIESSEDELFWFEPTTSRLLAVRTSVDEPLVEFAEFVPATAECLLGSWSHTGLSFFAGSAVYDTQFDLPDAFEGRKLELDLGTVGVAAEVWLNGEAVGERVWRPYTFDITAHAQPGLNDLRVSVANTHANRRAQRFEKYEMWDVLMAGPALLGRIYENGLIGPVRIVPWTEVEIECHPTETFP
jgi:glycosyl hydrolase family 106( putative alpha-L-rhamnosidase)/glycosyl hydrolase family 2